LPDLTFWFYSGGCHVSFGGGEHTIRENYEILCVYTPPSSYSVLTSRSGASSCRINTKVRVVVPIIPERLQSLYHRLYDPLGVNCRNETAVLKLSITLNFPRLSRMGSRKTVS
jgi:hypothetical protein